MLAAAGSTTVGIAEVAKMVSIILNRMDTQMKFLTPGSILIFLALVVANSNTAVADHTVLVSPQSERHQSESFRSNRNSKARFRGPLITTYFGGGVGSGGDVVGRFTDNFGSTDRVRSGGGFLVEGGVLAAVYPSTMLRLTAGYEIDSTGRFNGSSTFDRVRFDLMALRNFGGHEFGVGVTAHTNVGFRCDINSICASDVEFDDALGFTLEYALTTLGSRSVYGSRFDNRRHPLRTARLGLRFTDIEYEPQLGQVLSADDAAEFSGGDLEGRSLSLFFGFAF